MLLFRDVTELRELDRTRREFLTAISHELKRPLMSIAMSDDLLAESAADELGPQARELLDGVSEDVKRLRTLVGELLDLSRLEAGKIELDFRPADVELICQKAFQVLGARCGNRVSSWCRRSRNGSPRPTDVNKVTWVVTNLMWNALRYSSAGGRIEVRASRTESQRRGGGP